MPVVFRSRWWQVWPGCWTLSFIYPDTCANENVLPTGTTGLDVPQKRQPCPASFFPSPALGIAISHTHIHQPKVIAKTFFQLKSFQETFREKCNNDPYPGYCSPMKNQYCATLTNRLLFFSCSRPFYTLTSSALVEKKVASVNKDKKRPTNRDRSCNSQGCSGQGNAVGSEKK